MFAILQSKVLNTAQQTDAQLLNTPLYQFLIPISGTMPK